MFGKGQLNSSLPSAFMSDLQILDTLFTCCKVGTSCSDYVFYCICFLHAGKPLFLSLQVLLEMFKCHQFILKATLYHHFWKVLLEYLPLQCFRCITKLSKPKLILAALGTMVYSGEKTKLSS